MKRTAQMARAGTPSASQPSKFKGFRKLWKRTGPVQLLHPLRTARALAMAEAEAEAERKERTTPWDQPL
mgnify:CR=1 FL=1